MGYLYTNVKLCLLKFNRTLLFNNIILPGIVCWKTNGICQSWFHWRVLSGIKCSVLLWIFALCFYVVNVPRIYIVKYLLNYLSKKILYSVIIMLHLRFNRMDFFVMQQHSMECVWQYFIKLIFVCQYLLSP